MQSLRVPVDVYPARKQWHNVYLYSCPALGKGKNVPPSPLLQMIHTKDKGNQAGIETQPQQWAALVFLTLVCSAMKLRTHLLIHFPPSYQTYHCQILIKEEGRRFPYPCPLWQKQLGSKYYSETPCFLKELSCFSSPNADRLHKIIMKTFVNAEALCKY